MQIRRPVVAGQFYPAQHEACIDEINEYIEQIIPPGLLPETIVAGIVPHAGWTFSGTLALMVFSAIKQQYEKVNTFVIFGAAHGYFGPVPAIYDSGIWTTPMGDVVIDRDLADVVVKSGTVTSDTEAHKTEHSIEVQVPLIQHFFPSAKILPILTPPSEQAISVGKVVGDAIKAERNKKIVCIGSTDLTHYGPRYGFEPMGADQKALQWASDVNDKEFIDLALKLEPEKLLENAAKNSNACGPGAVAATIAAAKKLGKISGQLLAHTNSNQIMLQKFGSPGADSVGYAAIVF